MNKNKNIVAIDLGYGNTKIVFQDRFGEVYKLSKPSVVAKIAKTIDAEDRNIINIEGYDYYAFEPALRAPNSQILDLKDYNDMKEISIVIITKVIEDISKHYEVNTLTDLVLGLPISHMNLGNEYRDFLSKQFNIDKDRIVILAQGFGAKFRQDLIDHHSDYFGVDIGFNTIDVFSVINGEFSVNNASSLEREGICKVADKLSKYLKDTYKIELTERHINKALLGDNSISYRGMIFDYKDELNKIKVDYCQNLLSLLEENYSSIIDNSARIIMYGGGASIFRQVKNQLDLSNYGPNFIIIPEAPEFYNALGYYNYASF